MISQEAWDELARRLYAPFYPVEELGESWEANGMFFLNGEVAAEAIIRDGKVSIEVPAGMRVVSADSGETQFYGPLTLEIQPA